MSLIDEIQTDTAGDTRQALAHIRAIVKREIYGTTAEGDAELLAGCLETLGTDPQKFRADYQALREYFQACKNRDDLKFDGKKSNEAVSLAVELVQQRNRELLAAQQALADALQARGAAEHPELCHRMATRAVTLAGDNIKHLCGDWQPAVKHVRQDISSPVRASRVG